jgi:hypothetical protein
VRAADYSELQNRGTLRSNTSLRRDGRGINVVSATVFKMTLGELQSGRNRVGDTHRLP